MTGPGVLTFLNAWKGPAWLLAILATGYLSFILALHLAPAQTAVDRREVYDSLAVIRQRLHDLDLEGTESSRRALGELRVLNLEHQRSIDSNSRVIRQLCAASSATRRACYPTGEP